MLDVTSIMLRMIFYRPEEQVHAPPTSRDLET